MDLDLSGREPIYAPGPHPRCFLPGYMCLILYTVLEDYFEVVIREAAIPSMLLVDGRIITRPHDI